MSHGVLKKRLALLNSLSRASIHLQFSSELGHGLGDWELGGVWSVDLCPFRDRPHIGQSSTSHLRRNTLWYGSKIALQMEDQ